MNTKPFSIAQPSSALLKGLYAITDTPLMGERLLDSVEAALKGGCTVVQYRDKSSDHARRQQEAQALVELCNRYNSLLLVNDDIELAKTVAAPGVHIGQTDGSLKAARELLGDDAIIGVTCHDSLKLAIEAEQGGADYVAFGAFFPSSTKPNAIPAPLELLQQAREKLQIPIVAIGGITLDNSPQVIAPGADMVAVVHALFAADDINAQARAFQAQFA